MVLSAGFCVQRKGDQVIVQPQTFCLISTSLWLGPRNMLIVNAKRCPPRPSRARGVCGSTASRAGQVAIQERTGSGVVGPMDVMGMGKAMPRTRSESWSQESVALRAGAVDVMGGSCAESPDNQNAAVALNARGSLDRLCWRGFFSSVDRSESGIGCLRAHSSQNGNPTRTAGGFGLGLRLGWPSLGAQASLSTPDRWLGSCVRHSLVHQTGLRSSPLGCWLGWCSAPKTLTGFGRTTSVAPMLIIPCLLIYNRGVPWFSGESSLLEETPPINKQGLIIWLKTKIELGLRR